MSKLAHVVSRYKKHRTDEEPDYNIHPYRNTQTDRSNEPVQGNEHTGYHRDDDAIRTSVDLPGLVLRVNPWNNYAKEEIEHDRKETHPGEIPGGYPLVNFALPVPVKRHLVGKEAKCYKRHHNMNGKNRVQHYFFLHAQSFPCRVYTQDTRSWNTEVFNE